MATHAGIAFASEQQHMVREWEAASNSLVLLAVENEEQLRQFFDYAAGQGLPVTPFYEPDIGDELTAIALFADDDIGAALDTLPLALRDTSDSRWERETILRKGVAV